MKAFVPHLSAALSLALLVVVILDVFNPMLGLLKGTPFLVLVGAVILFSLWTAFLRIRSQRRRFRAMHHHHHAEGEEHSHG